MTTAVLTIIFILLILYVLSMYYVVKRIYAKGYRHGKYEGYIRGYKEAETQQRKWRNTL